MVLVDAGVFLEAGSFSSTSPFDISTTGNSVGPIGSSNTLYENCGSLNLILLAQQHHLQLLIH
jgi:hypothetical protein